MILAGMDDYVSKPLNKEELFAKISRVLDGDADIGVGKSSDVTAAVN